MKYIISEKQYRLLAEQKPVQKKDDWWNRPSYDRREWEKSTKTLENFGKLDPHTLATILQIGTAFIPVVGPFISAGIGLADAALYYKEGENQTAGLVAGFSMLPFVGSIVSKIPGIKQLGVKGMATLASKLGRGGQTLSKAETEIANAIKNYTPKIQEELSKMAPKLKKVVKDIDLYKPKYINKYGEREYNRILTEFLYDGIDQKTFINTLKNVKDPSIKLKPVLAGGADHRVFQSATNPNVVFKAEIRPGEIEKWYDLFKKYPKIFANTFKKTRVKGEDGKILSAVVMEKLELKSFMKLWDDIEKVLFQTQKTLPYNQQITNLEFLTKKIKNPSYGKIWDNILMSSKKIYPDMIDKIDEFKEMIDKLYKITPNPDIRKFNFGYDTSGVLKALDL